MHSIDARQLAFPGTGLALVTGELLAALPSVAGEEVAVLVPPRVPLQAFDLPSAGLRVIEVAHRGRHPDYVDRVAWARAVQQARRKAAIDGRHFVPYLYNYGSTRDNVVLIPDLVYRLYPDYGVRDPAQSRWNPRGRLPFRRIARRWEESRVARSRRILVISEFVRRQVHESLHVPMDRMTVLPLAAPRWIRNASDDAVGLPPGVPDRFALYTGGYAARKNVPMLLRACGRAYEADSSFRCVFIGLSDDVLGQHRELRECMDIPAVRQAVIRIGRVSNHVLAAVYRRCAFVLYPSHSEGFGLPVVEAAACGKLCLCGDNSSLQDVQPHAEFRIPSDDESRWGAAAAHYWTHPDEAAQAGRESLAIDRRFNWTDSARVLWRALDES